MDSDALGISIENGVLTEGISFAQSNTTTAFGFSAENFKWNLGVKGLKAKESTGVSASLITSAKLSIQEDLLSEEEKKSIKSGNYAFGAYYANNTASFDLSNTNLRNVLGYLGKNLNNQIEGMDAETFMAVAPTKFSVSDLAIPSDMLPLMNIATEELGEDTKLQFDEDYYSFYDANTYMAIHADMKSEDVNKLVKDMLPSDASFSANVSKLSWFVTFDETGFKSFGLTCDMAISFSYQGVSYNVATSNNITATIRNGAAVVVDTVSASDYPDIKTVLPVLDVA